VKPRFQAAVTALGRSFLRRRPLRTGSLIISLFGDSIAPRGGEISLASLIALMAAFGLTQRLVRTAVGRLAQEGWLDAERAGRVSFYGLTRLGRERFAEATRRIYAPPPAAWRGRWTLILADGNARSRRSLRAELGWLGFGQLGPATFAHPDADLGRVRRELSDPALLDDAVILTAQPVDARSDRQLIDRGWNLRDLERRYRRFIDLFKPLLEAANAGGTLDPQACLVARTLLIHEYRRVHLRDPLLPRSLLPPHWAGAAAYELCRKLYGLVYASADRHLDAVALTRRGRLPAPHADLHRRFGRL
jgi:phenylacetic acid degradation operon negative regulatory protein